MNKKYIIIIILSAISIYFIKNYYFLPTKYQDKLTNCSAYMEENNINMFSKYKTDEDIIKKCNNESFVVLDQEYAKDNNFVYFRPMPNANRKTNLVKDADPKTFELYKRCPGLAIDKYHVFRFGLIYENKIPSKELIIDDPQTWCE